MYEYNSYGNYVTRPVMVVSGKNAVLGADALHALIGQSLVIVADLYPGIDETNAEQLFMPLFSDALIIRTRDILRSEDELDDVFRDNLSDDRVFGFMSRKDIDVVFDPCKLEDARHAVSTASGKVLVIGVGAALVTDRQDLLLYFDINRWEIQLRYRSGMPNWLWHDEKAPILEKYKRGFFIEWRLADRHKDGLLERMDYILDGNGDEFKAISREDFRLAMSSLASRPFRMEPYFDPGVWGGKWMMKTIGLPEKENYAWSFDGVPEENSINLGFGNGYVSLPAMDLTLSKADELLGGKVKARFGREFPIRFDFLDTMDGQNLSLQVHPLTEYIQNKFGMNYTQDESYYILDCKEDACVYIGLKEGIDKDGMIADLRRAEKGEISFPVEKYVNKIPVKKHDHVLIPAGTVHCSGRNAMVLEISSTPYIFTFKLWDWGRVGLDGLPRPIHLEHGRRNIQWNRTTSFVERELIHQERVIASSDGVTAEHTGLHELEFIETERWSVESDCTIEMKGSVEQLNLVEGRSCLITSPDGSFEPLEIHYAESFIVPAAVGRYKIEANDGAIKLLRAYVRC